MCGGRLGSPNLVAPWRSGRGVFSTFLARRIVILPLPRLLCCLFLCTWFMCFRGEVERIHKERARERVRAHSQPTSSHPPSSPREIVAPIPSPPTRRIVRVVPAPAPPPLEEPPPPSPPEVESASLPLLPPPFRSYKTRDQGAPVHPPRPNRVYTSVKVKDGASPRKWLTLNKYIAHPKHGLVLLNQFGYGKDGKWGDTVKEEQRNVSPAPPTLDVEDWEEGGGGRGGGGEEGRWGREVAPVHPPKRIRIYTANKVKNGASPRVWLTLNKFIKNPKHGWVVLKPKSRNGRK